MLLRTDPFRDFDRLAQQMTELAATIGTGNIAGVATAIFLGGPGAIFWMWVVALVGMATSYFECSLAQLYKRREADGSYRGGPAFYIQHGLGQRSGLVADREPSGRVHRVDVLRQLQPAARDL